MYIKMAAVHAIKINMMIKKKKKKYKISVQIENLNIPK